jgi:starch synthase
MTVKKKDKTIRILFISSEADPFIKVGGLGDVAYALPQALKDLPSDLIDGYELDIRVAIPCHANICNNVIGSKSVASFTIPNSKGDIPVEVIQTSVNNVTVYLFSGNPVVPADSPVYSGNNRVDGFKYFFFSLATLELTRQINWKPDILHANDWHTALAVYRLNELRKTDPFYKNCHSIITVHNLVYMGTGAESELEGFGIIPENADALPEWARLLPLPLGLLTADEVVAVSPTYAKEIKTPEFGCGLQNYLNTRNSTVTGIINGIDQVLWSPTNDINLAAKYDVNHLELRKLNKEALIKEFDFSSDINIPIFTLIGRLDPQKGVDVAIEALRQLSDLPWHAIILGTGFSKIENDAIILANEFPEQVRAVLKFDAKLSRRLYGGADMVLMPSRFEPCGLVQMIAMRYGCVPVARATGGLRDTIIDYSDQDNSTGFLFANPIGSDLAGAMTRALSTFEDQVSWKSLQIRGMEHNFSWQEPAISYANIYKKLVHSKKELGEIQENDF